MAVLVPFDGSVLAKSALFHGARAAELDGTPLLATTVIPVNNTEYADKKGWITSDEEFDKNESSLDSASRSKIAFLVQLSNTFLWAGTHPVARWQTGSAA